MEVWFMSSKDEKVGTPPWGRWLVLQDEVDFKVKRIEVLPGHRLSYQKHFRREEHWQIVRGEAKVTIDGIDYTLKAGACIRIPRESFHRIQNTGDKELIFIEVQRGDYFGEDDIVRIEDDYGRNTK
ncbi:MAG TPA: phosphomannose isomerase type II C-terminal cupin domain [Syntrophorhabdaceae bacterium]|nr:phosphomannose isomerase type II C-terminal cupin domain [Syntrophorhabdaceae bacterium]